MLKNFFTRSFQSSRYLSNFNKIPRCFFSDQLNLQQNAEDKIGLMLTMENKPGVLGEFAKIFSRNGVNLSYINSKPSKFLTQEKRFVDFFIDCEAEVGNNNLEKALDELKQKGISIDILRSEKVPWFPKNKLELNNIGKKCYMAGEELSSEHPGFNDDTYTTRRKLIAEISKSYRMEDDLDIPTVDYTDVENATWKACWNNLIPLHKKYACEEIRENMDHFIKEVGYTEERIPQMKDISAYLRQETNTIFRPVAGMLSQREFLNGLAFRVFHSTQYIRHHSLPLYTPEPDLVHEILGHTVLFANKDFADFSQEIGLASLGASDEDLNKLGAIYMYTIEFGLCLQKGETKIYGAGILSSPSEIEWCLSGKPRINKFDLEVMGRTPFSITEMQSEYFLASSFSDMKKAVVDYVENIKKPFNISYNTTYDTVEIDRKIKIADI